jgi:hypothetical protein
MVEVDIVSVDRGLIGLCMFSTWEACVMGNEKYVIGSADAVGNIGRPRSCVDCGVVRL